jgi:uncharacterized protein YjiS (DUF1127 family)
MTLKIVTRTNVTAPPIEAGAYPLATLMRAIWQLVTVMKHRREFRYLAGLDDRMLADIGLTRADFNDADLLPSWQDRTTMLAGRAAERSASRQRVGLTSAARIEERGDL